MPLPHRLEVRGGSNSRPDLASTPISVLLFFRVLILFLLRTRRRLRPPIETIKIGRGTLAPPHLHAQTLCLATAVPLVRDALSAQRRQGAWEGEMMTREP